MVHRKALGSGGLKNVVEAVDAIGADGVAEIAGWHQAYGSREAASMIRRGLAVAQKGGEELKAALAEGRKLLGTVPAQRAFYRAFRDFNPLNGLGIG